MPERSEHESLLRFGAHLLSTSAVRHDGRPIARDALVQDRPREGGDGRFEHRALDTLADAGPNVLLVHPLIPANSVKDLIALAKSKPGQLNYGSAGNGSAGHLAFEYLKMVSDTFMLHVPYRGTGPMLTDLMAGRLQAASVGAPALLPFIKAGKLRCIATGTASRLPQLPDVPTVAEQGYKGFEMTQWYGLLAPSRWQKPNLAKLETEAIRATQSTVVSDKLGQETAQAVGNSSAAFGAFIRAEQARWKPVIARAEIKPEGI